MSLMSEEVYRKYFSHFQLMTNEPFTIYGVGTDETEHTKALHFSRYINATFHLGGSQQEMVGLSGEIQILSGPSAAGLIIGNNILRPARAIIALGANGSGLDLLIIGDVTVTVRSLWKPLAALTAGRST